MNTTEETQCWSIEKNNSYYSINLMGSLMNEGLIPFHKSMVASKKQVRLINSFLFATMHVLQADNSIHLGDIFR